MPSKSNEIHQCTCGKKCKTWNGLAKHLARMKFIEDAGWCPKGHHKAATVKVGELTAAAVQEALDAARKK